jgi:hypothetical protein
MLNATHCCCCCCCCSCCSSAALWLCRRLDPSVPLPGLLNMEHQPRLVGVSPRCVASNGLAPLRVSVYGMYLQGSAITVRHAGRYLGAL